MGGDRLVFAYDLLNTRIHIKDKDFALDDGLLPKNLAQDKIMHQFSLLVAQADISPKSFSRIKDRMLSASEKVETLILSSFLDPTIQQNHLQSYQERLRQLQKV